MPTYAMICDACTHSYEEFCAFKDIPKKCPECGKNKLHQNYKECGGSTCIAYGNIDTVTTMGQAAELNHKRLGKERLQKLAEENSIENRRRKVLKLPEGASRKPVPVEKPWWRSEDKPLNLNKIKNTKKYIETGEKN